MNGTETKNSLHFSIFFFFLTFFTPIYATNPQINIGFQRLTETQIDFTPFEQYLEQEIPEYDFNIILYSPNTIIEALLWGEVEFAICNPYVYYYVNTQKGCKALATFTRLGPNNQPLTLRAGAIFCEASRNDINYLEDLKGKTIASPGKDFFAGWILPLYELYSHGLSPISNFATVVFTGSYESTINAVLNGTADIGFIDAYTIWKLTKEGKINEDKIKIINQKAKDPNFPIPHSTIVYPEFCFVSLNNVPEALQRKLSIALLKYPMLNPLTKPLGF